MAGHHFQNMADGDVITPFDPANDTLLFDQGASAAATSLRATGTGTVVAQGGKSVTVADLAPAALAPLLVFADSRYFVGSDAADTFLGTDGADRFDLRAGGNDSLAAGNGDDLVDVGAALTAADVLDGGAGLDELRLAGGGAALVVGAGVSGFETIAVGPGGRAHLVFEAGALAGTPALSIRADTLASSEALVLAAQAFAGGMTVFAGAAADSLATGAGNDSLVGAGGKDRLDGGAGRDTLRGGAGNDTLVGGADREADVLDGGEGDDTYYVAAGDRIAETVAAGSSGGVDLVVSSIDWVLGKDQENLTLAGTRGIDGTGNSLANVIRGNDAGNVLDGGSKGQDTLIGGLGNDVYHVNGDDTVVERSGGGTDRVFSSASHVLGWYLEDLTLTGARNISGTGHSRANRIDGNTGNNVLDGAGGNDTLQGMDGRDRLLGGKGDDKLYGGSGADTLDGGSGRDTLAGGDGADIYFVDSKDDVVVEKSSYVIEIDTVISSVDRTLGANQDNLVLTGKAVVGIGSGDDNRITGTDRANVLDGRGGYDTMVGGKGNDTYHVDRPEDSVIESVNGGIDHVISTGDWTLGIYEEHLTLAGKGYTVGQGNELGNRIVGSSAQNEISGMGGDDTVSGGGGNDRLWGGAGVDRLDGGAGNDTIMGGAGSDFLIGGAGSDSFRFEAEQDSNPRHFDTILDFKHGEDVIDLSALYFGANSAFRPFIGKAAFDLEDATGQVRYEYEASSRSVMVYVSADASNDAEGALRIMGISSLSAADFNFFDWW